ncbi:hypothetical protein SAMN05446935_7555 [Burkholderia sp. YR290]|nr:hypothetical protein SAMN05446935_7555 [Burkholderia sp. YR290]
MSTSNETLTNSRRRFEKLAYTPLTLASPRDNEPCDALGTAALVRMLKITDAEMKLLEQNVQNRAQTRALSAIVNLRAAVSGQERLAAAAALGAASTGALLGVGDALLAIRAKARDTLAGALRALDTSYDRFQVETPVPGAANAPAEASPAAKPARPDSGEPQEAQVGKRGDQVDLKPPPDMLRLAGPLLPARPQPSAVARAAGIPTALTVAALQPRVLAMLGTQTASRLPSVLTWAQSRPEQMKPLQPLVQAYLPVGLDAQAIVSSLISMDVNVSLVMLFNDALTRRPLQPLGLLHLERLVMTPLNIERGELLYSLPLAPNEKVTLAHKEWSVRDEQFAQFIEDYLENYSENGVAQSDDISMSSSSETLHSNALNLSQPLASASGVAVTSAVDATSAASSTVQDDTARQESVSHSRTITALASARTIKDQKTSFTVTTVSGMEDFTAHLIENKHADKSMRVDYFRRVRKWLSEHYRYGVRLTYDVVLPDPASKIRDRQVELEQIALALAAEFHLALTPSDISVVNWEWLADQYGVQLPPPPDQNRRVESSLAVDYSPNEEVTIHGAVHTRQKIDQLTLALPTDYVFANLYAVVNVSTWHVTFQKQWVTVLGSGGGGSFVPDASGYINNWLSFDVTQLPQVGGVSAAFWSQYVSSGTLKLIGVLSPTENAMEAWRSRCWSIIRDSSYANYAQHRSYLRDRQSALLKEIAADDAVMLRRREKEQIMRAVLEWLFPGFDDAASVLTSLPSPGSLDADTWQQVMEYGEYIKFVQTAIDWDNVMVFLYPYFWDTPAHAAQKLYLDHPDPIHREFLRAGAARVIVAIKPGFEEDVVSLLDQGQLGNLPDESRFAKVIQDVQEANAAYMATAAPGDPSTSEVKEPGELVGKWMDYTPSGALDIEVTVAPVLSAP